MAKKSESKGLDDPGPRGHELSGAHELAEALTSWNPGIVYDGPRSRRPRWEYCFAEFAPGCFTIVMDSLGGDGWEAFAVDTFHGVAYMKRQL